MSREFTRARRAAWISDLFRLLRELPTDLLSFDQVHERLRLRGLMDRGLQDIPLDRIVGTLGRHREFNRVFLPRDETLRERWQKVASLAEGVQGLPPIEVYQVDDAFFVVDGHHRVSVMRRFGASTIEAYVKEFQTRVPLSSEESVESILRKEGLADFLDATGLKPVDDEEFVCGVVNGYERLLDHISVHRYFLGLDLQRDVDWQEAVDHWYRTLYRPVIELVADSEIGDLRPDAGATDFYLFTMDHLHALREQYGDPEIDPEQAVEALTREQLEARQGLMRRLSDRLKVRRGSPHDP